MPAPQPATSQISQSSCKRHRETIQELNADPTEDEVDPCLPAQERNELLDESTNDDSSSDMPKKKVIPNEQLLGLLKAYTVWPLKNDSWRKVIDQLLYAGKFRRGKILANLAINANSPNFFPANTYKDTETTEDLPLDPPKFSSPDVCYISPIQPPSKSDTIQQRGPR